MSEPYIFNGPEYVPGRDNTRLKTQMQAVRDYMIDGCWRDLEAISINTGHPPASVSAQLRHLRKERFGSYRVERRHVQGGLFQYRVLPPVPIQLELL